jgi:hypothetical protein
MDRTGKMAASMVKLAPPAEPPADKTADNAAEKPASAAKPA